MSIKRTLSILILLLVTCTVIPLSAVTWKVFMYIDTSDELSDMAIKNITDMIRGKPDDSIDWVIQLHAYYKAGLRYRVSAKGLQFIEEITLTGDSKHDFIDAANWAFTDHHADYTMLIMSNHGWGILDPIWDQESETWQAETNVMKSCTSAICMIKKTQKSYWPKQHSKHKGFMFSINRSAYLTNQDLVDGLSYIKETILQGKKLDILAFDTCMGAMFEIGYLVAPYSQYLVGSQSCSLRDGFDYQNIISLVKQGPSPCQLVEGMVQTFNAYYSKNDESGIYTHAALDLTYIYEVNKNLDQLINMLLNIPQIRSVLLQACDTTPRFCMWPMYTDLVTFIKRVEENLSMLSIETTELSKAFNNFFDSIFQLVTSRCGGCATQRLAHGVAIYMPSTKIDSSYYKTTFVCESQWIKLLEAMA